MNIGFVHVTNQYDVHWWPSLAFGSLKAYLHSKLGDSVTMSRVNPQELYKYDIVALSSTTQDYNFTKRIASSVRQQNPNAVIVLGGSHITWLPQTLTKDFDFGVIGEGEQTFVELVTYVMNGRKTEDLFKINGIAFPWGEGGLFTAQRALIEPLDLIPPPFREAQTHMQLFTSRGCPYRCNFCSSSAFWKKTRFHSSEYVVSEFERLINMGANHIPVMDDLFIADKSRFVDIIEKIKQRGLDKKFTTAIMARANLINQDLCDILKAAPFITEVRFGAESACDRILGLMGKNLSASKNQEAIDTLYANEIPGGCSCIIGWPLETEEELITTVDFVQRNIREGKLPLGGSLNILMPLPGTVVWGNAVKAGIIDLNNFNFDRLGVFAPQANVASFEEWVNVRRTNNSLYLNEDCVPQERMYEILRAHYATIGY